MRLYEELGSLLDFRVAAACTDIEVFLDSGLYAPSCASGVALVATSPLAAGVSCNTHARRPTWAIDPQPLRTEPFKVEILPSSTALTKFVQRTNKYQGVLWICAFRQTCSIDTQKNTRKGLAGDWRQQFSTPRIMDSLDLKQVVEVLLQIVPKTT